MTNTAREALQLPFGSDTTWEIATRNGVHARLNSTAAASLDLAREVDRALNNPIDFTAFDQLVVPGDQLVFAVDCSVPNMQELLREVLAWFGRHGSSATNMRVVLASDKPGLAESVSAYLSEALGESIHVEVHDSSDQECLAYVAANEEGLPIYMNRTLVDADVVVPIVCARSSSALDNFGAFGIYPLLSDRETRRAFYRLAKLSDRTALEKLRNWADEAARWAGFLVEVQVIPATGNEIGQITAGLTEPVSAVAQEQMDEQWRTEIALADLAIALLDGDTFQQTWLQIARALYSANQCCKDGGAIVLCTEAKETLGKSLNRLRDVASQSSLEEAIAKDASHDSIFASLLNQVTANKHVYLVSKMRSDMVESLGVGVLSQPSQLERLLEQFEVVNILSSAQHRGVAISG